MAGLIIILAVLNLVAGEWTVTGRRLSMSTHPVVLRVRWFSLGAVAVLFLVGHDFTGDDWLSWVLAIVLAFAVTRFPVSSTRVGEACRSSAVPNGSPAVSVDNPRVAEGPTSVS